MAGFFFSAFTQPKYTFPLAKSTAVCQHVVMVCIYCGATTRVINSRLQKQVNNIWRRRKCSACSNIFTTKEIPELETTFVVESGHGLIPFSRDRLFVSIYQSCKHRQSAVDDANALTQLVIGQLVASHKDAVIERSEIVRVASTALSRFDNTAATVYAAYHRP